MSAPRLHCRSERGIKLQKCVGRPFFRSDMVCVDFTSERGLQHCGTHSPLRAAGLACDVPRPSRAEFRALVNARLRAPLPDRWRLLPAPGTAITETTESARRSSQDPRGELVGWGTPIWIEIVLGCQNQRRAIPLAFPVLVRRPTGDLLRNVNRRLRPSR